MHAALREPHVVHIAIIDSGLVDALLTGRKTIESRLSARRVLPFEAVNPGDRIYFKRRGGAFGATAIVAHVEYYTNLTRAKVDALRQIYGDRVLGSDSYWRSKQNAKYATFIHLGEAQQTELAPDYRSTPSFSPRAAWHTLPDSMDIYPPSVAA